MSNVLERAWGAVAPLVPRLLTQLERDPDSPNFGCFDRDFWHYKMRDFSSAILQQGGLSVDALSCLNLPGNPLFESQQATVWADASIDFLFKRQLGSGGFEEYYPFESGYPPAAFGLYAAGLIWQQRGFPKLSAQQTKAVQRACDWLLNTPETEALNQEAAGLTGLSLASRVPGVQVDAARLDERLGNFYRAQSEEGWFPEYGGPDLGYLCVTLDCLWDLHALTGDTRAWAAMKRAVPYIEAMFASGGHTPTMINSRNTDYLVPYGLARLGGSDPHASACVHAMLSRIAEPGHFLHATDDRYLSHYIGQSFFRSLAYLDKLAEPAPLPSTTGGEFFFPEAGQYVRHEGGTSLFFAGAKGGVTYLYDINGLVDADFGWRISMGKKQGVTHWQSPQWEVAYLKEEETVLMSTGMLHAQGYAASTPIRHMALRVLSKLFGNRLIPFLKRVLIFRAAPLPISFERELRIGMAGLALTDRFSCLPDGVEPTPATQQSLRHVASAARFCLEELQPVPVFDIDQESGGFIARRLFGTSG